jgi:hypothetical protein
MIGAEASSLRDRSNSLLREYACAVRLNSGRAILGDDTVLDAEHGRFAAPCRNTKLFFPIRTSECASTSGTAFNFINVYELMLLKANLSGSG